MVGGVRVVRRFDEAAQHNAERLGGGIQRRVSVVADHLFSSSGMNILS